MAKLKSGTMQEESKDTRSKGISRQDFFIFTDIVAKAIKKSIVGIDIGMQKEIVQHICNETIKHDNLKYNFNFDKFIRNTLM